MQGNLGEEEAARTRLEIEKLAVSIGERSFGGVDNRGSTEVFGEAAYKDPTSVPDTRWEVMNELLHVQHARIAELEQSLVRVQASEEQCRGQLDEQAGQEVVAREVVKRIQEEKLQESARHMEQVAQLKAEAETFQSQYQCEREQREATEAKLAACQDRLTLAEERVANLEERAASLVLAEESMMSKSREIHCREAQAQEQLEAVRSQLAKLQRDAIAHMQEQEDTRILKQQNVLLRADVNELEQAVMRSNLREEESANKIVGLKQQLAVAEERNFDLSRRAAAAQVRQEQSIDRVRKQMWDLIGSNKGRKSQENGTAVLCSVDRIRKQMLAGDGHKATGSASTETSLEDAPMSRVITSSLERARVLDELGGLGKMHSRNDTDTAPCQHLMIMTPPQLQDRDEVSGMLSSSQFSAMEDQPNETYARSFTSFSSPSLEERYRALWSQYTESQRV